MDWTYEPVFDAYKAFKVRMQLFLEDNDVTDIARQVTKIKIALRDEGMRRLLVSHLTDERKKQPAEIWQLIESQIDIAAKINFRIHRLEFAQMRQLSEESVTSYVARLRRKAERCGFGIDELNERLIEMVIFSTKFEEFRKELMCKPNGYSIQEVIEKGRQYEATETSNISGKDETSLDGANRCGRRT